MNGHRGKLTWHRSASGPDYGLVELGECARQIWVNLPEHVGVGRREALTLNEMRELVRSPEGEAATRELALAIAGDQECRTSLHQLVAELAEGARARLGRWAPVLVETPYPRAVTRVIHLQARLTRLQTVLGEYSLNWRPVTRDPATPSRPGRQPDPPRIPDRRRAPGGRRAPRALGAAADRLTALAGLGSAATG